jgi:diadenosine tetraphosphatase ApaH/serine/threonine PP2A family protein phosphatase
MRYLVLTDIHANLEALDTCLAAAREHGFDETLILGDLVGYGPDPNAAVERVQALEPRAIVRGNHDKVACGLDQAEGFNSVAKSAAHWTYDVLAPANREWLAALPQGPASIDDLIEICHGSPFDEDYYIFDEGDALRALKSASRPLCLFGHTHYPVIYHLSNGRLDGTGPSHAAEVRLPIDRSARYLLNPGAVGQPRDGDPRAACAIVDTAIPAVDLLRLNYEVKVTQAKIIAAGLPEVLARRLAAGR